MHVIDTLPRETRRDLLALLLELENDGQELLDVARRHVVAVRPLDERLALQVQDRDQARHRGGFSKGERQKNNRGGREVVQRAVEKGCTEVER